MIEIFRDTNYDFLSKKWICIALSCVVLLLGGASILWRTLDGNPDTHPFNMGVDFTGGTIVNAKFKQKPDPELIRAAIAKQGVEGSKVTIQPVGEEIGQPPKNEVLIRLPNLANLREGGGQTDAERGGRLIRTALASLNDQAQAQNKVDLNAVGRESLKEELMRLDPLKILSTGGQSAETRYREVAARIIDYRDKDRRGLVSSIDEIKNLGGIDPQLGQALDERFFTGVATIKSTDEVSPQVGSQLRNRAIYATLFACLGILLFVAFRFKSWGFGIGGVTAVFHDVLITLSIFSIMQWEINLTVIAALLTLVGFSMNDTIVIFDRIREIMKTKRREGLVKITNSAINETLSRTVITNGLALLTVFALVLFGGEVLKSFSWALFIGVVVGTYSTVYIASPVMLWWERWRAKSKVVAEGIPAGTKAAPAGESSKIGSSSVTAQTLAAAGISTAPRKHRKKGK
jgi:preprotein translocase subunit SecF